MEKGDGHHPRVVSTSQTGPFNATCRLTGHKSNKMKNSRSKKSDLENKRGIYFQVGMVLSLAVVLAAFEWRTAGPGGVTLDFGRPIDTDEDLAEITVQKKKEPPKPVPVLVKKIVVTFNDAKIDDEPPEIRAEVDETTTNDPNYSPKEPDREQPEPQPFRIVEEMPSFPGGESALLAYLAQETKYPQLARETGIQGTVLVLFVVEKDGRITHIQVARTVGGGCDEEAVRVIENMPVWNPGKQRGVPVRVQMVIPVKFVLI